MKMSSLTDCHEVGFLLLVSLLSNTHFIVLCTHFYLHFSMLFSGAHMFATRTKP